MKLKFNIIFLKSTWTPCLFLFWCLHSRISVWPAGLMYRRPHPHPVSNFCKSRVGIGAGKRVSGHHAPRQHNTLHMTDFYCRRRVKATMIPADRYVIVPFDETGINITYQQHAMIISIVIHAYVALVSTLNLKQFNITVIT